MRREVNIDYGDDDWFFRLVARLAVVWAGIWIIALLLCLVAAVWAFFKYVA